MRLCAALFFLRSISPKGLAAWPSRQAALTPAAFGTKLGSNIAYFSKLGFLPKRVTRALGLAQDTGPVAFYFAFPPSRIRPRVQDLANMRPERPRRARRSKAGQGAEAGQRPPLRALRAGKGPCWAPLVSLHQTMNFLSKLVPKPIGSPTKTLIAGANFGEP